jgi:hypothetical protein
LRRRALEKKCLEATESEFTSGHFIRVPKAEDKLEDHVKTVQTVMRRERVP